MLLFVPLLFPVILGPALLSFSAEREDRPTFPFSQGSPVFIKRGKIVAVNVDDLFENFEGTVVVTRLLKHGLHRKESLEVPGRDVRAFL